jgi:hypothetical protein
MAEMGSAASKPSSSEHVAALKARFLAGRQRGETVHRREEARFALHLCHDAEEAFRLAKENWEVQREPADARILLESALAANQLDAVRLVERWITTNRLEDVRLTKLLAKDKTARGN